ncbi:HAD family hydrolase [uncultured Corynebacterium sp.]|uniref:HAD family hydrolase n=1 Tax=uncultured Corynebacterium sp. TaxID=159447 RepID=UPI0025DC3981|nr:hypothetical protein [uncultured Corynebacterium sp.]
MSTDITRPVLLFDFDGTVSLGHGPVLAYAHLIAEKTGHPSIAQDTEALLNSDNVGSARDGYHLVRTLAAELNVPEETCQEAYMASRENLADTGITAPEGLANFLASYPGRAILATNSPEIGLSAALRKLGLDRSFDTVYTRVGKPEGLTRILDTDLADTDPTHLISFGDIWEFDLAPVAAVGGRTVLVDSPFATSPEADPTWRVTRVTDIFPELTSAL